jgi:predicted RecB family endonuclease
MKFFISHPMRTDDALATELKASLLEAGHEVFETESESYWSAEMSAAIRRSDAVIALLNTPSNGVYFELGLAIGAHVPTLIVSPSVEGIPADLMSVPYLQLTGDPSHDVAVIVQRGSQVAEGRHRPQDAAQQTTDAGLLATTRDPSVLERLSPEEFETLVARLFRERGFTVSALARTGDIGADLVLGPDPVTIVEVKRYMQQNLVSVGAVRQLLGTLAITGAERGILVSSSGFTNAARALAAETPVELLTLEDLLSTEENPSAAVADIPDSSLTSINNLAETLRGKGDLAGARTLHEHVLDVRRRALGPEHPDTLSSMGNLADTLWAQGDLAGARALQEQTLDVLQRVLGPEHPDTLISMNNLTVMLRAQGVVAGARTLQEQTLDVF